jgi:signal peptidase I
MTSIDATEIVPTRTEDRVWQARARTALRIARLALLATLVVAWVVLLRPQNLGGPAGYEIVSGTSMVPTLADGDVVVVREQERYRIGDVVAFRVPAGDVGAGHHVIHRIVGGTSSTGFVTQGDNRDAPDTWRPRHEDVVGKQWLHVPGGGAVVRWVASPLVLAALAGLVAASLVLTGGNGRPAASEDETAEDDDGRDA